MSRLSNDTLIDRSAAALVGIGIGDAMGDLGRDDRIRRLHGILCSLPEGALSTDDTEFTVLTARSYLDCEGEFTSQYVADSWRRLVIADGGVQERGGLPLYGAMWNLSQGIEPPLSGADNVLNDDDGAAMRAVPFGIVGVGDPGEAARLAAIDAAVSHAGDGIAAACAVAASAAVALEGGPVKEVVSAGVRYLSEDSWLGRRTRLALDIAESNLGIIDTFEALHSRLWTPKHSVAAEAIPQMYALLLMADGDFRKGLVLSANFGRDADTICALVTSLSAARVGMSVFPDGWVDRVRHPAGVCLPFAAGEDLVTLGEDLAERAITRLGGGL